MKSRFSIIKFILAHPSVHQINPGRIGRRFLILNLLKEYETPGPTTISPWLHDGQILFVETSSFFVIFVQLCGPQRDFRPHFSTKLK